LNGESLFLFTFHAKSIGRYVTYHCTTMSRLIRTELNNLKQMVIYRG